MVKNTYIVPELLVVQLASRDALLTLSANDSLGVNDGGTTSANKIEEGDVKGVTDVNVWDKEW